MKEFEIAVPVGHEPTAKQIASYAGGLEPVLVKRSLDARKEPLWRYRYEAYSAGEYEPYKLPEYQDVGSKPAVIVVGAGPAGMFAALKLLTLGLKPIVLERGKDVHERKFDMAALSRTGEVNPDSNYCYGEGGAGAFSDGKLYTRSSKRGDNREVLYQLVQFGASREVLYDAHPHIGSDKLPIVVENIRNCVLKHGGEYHFGARVTAVEGKPGDFTVATAEGVEYKGIAVILATGHSARDIYEMLQRGGGALEAKGFALGVRVEHPQEKINYAQYHGKWRQGMPAAEYSFVEQQDGRGVFSFCMCPGGILVPSSTEPGTVVLNGMSNSSRNGRFANSGVVVQIEPEDVPGTDPFRLMDFQHSVEAAMFRYCDTVRHGGAELEAIAARAGLRPSRVVVPSNPAAAPAQRLEDFIAGSLSKSLPETTYHPGIVSAPLHKLLPAHVADRLRKVFPRVKINNYCVPGAGLVLGVESRTSSPVRIPRDPDTLQYSSEPGIWPAGEGAGYSGGIVSSAIDGIRCAAAIAEAFRF